MRLVPSPWSVIRTQLSGVVLSADESGEAPQCSAEFRTPTQLRRNQYSEHERLGTRRYAEGFRSREHTRADYRTAHVRPVLRGISKVDLP